MKVILKDFIPDLGGMGDIVDVANGYGRNYLLPRGLAVRASTDNIARLEHERAAIDREKVRGLENAQTLAAKLNGYRCTFEKAVAENGKLYGSVTQMEVEAMLHAAGFPEISRRQLGLGGPIKEPGEVEVSIKVHSDVTATITVEVLALEGE